MIWNKYISLFNTYTLKENTTVFIMFSIVGTDKSY